MLGAVEGGWAMERLTDAVPGPVWRRVGERPEDVTRLGSSRVLRGNGNVIWDDGHPVWIDWEECSRAPAVAELATWIHGSAFVPPSQTRERDLAAYGPVDTRAVEAAFLLLFLALDVPVLGEVADAPSLVAERVERATHWIRQQNEPPTP